MGPGNAGVPLLVGGERPKSSESFWPGENDARRLLDDDGVGGGEFSLLAIAVFVEGMMDREALAQLRCSFKKRRFLWYTRT